MFHPLLDIEEFKPGELVLFRLSSSTYLWPAANVPIKNIAKIANVFLFINCQYLWSFQEQVHSAFWVMAPQIVESCHPRWENMDNMEKMENISHMTWNTLFMIQNSLLRTQSTLFAMQVTQTTLVQGIYGDGWKSHNIWAWRIWSWFSSRLKNVKQLVEACHLDNF